MTNDIKYAEEITEELIKAEFPGAPSIANAIASAKADIKNSIKKVYITNDGLPEKASKLKLEVFLGLSLINIGVIILNSNTLKLFG